MFRRVGSIIETKQVKIYGEKSTKYFLNLEKRNHIKKHIRKLHIGGVIKTDPFCILKEQETLY